MIFPRSVFFRIPPLAAIVISAIVVAGCGGGGGGGGGGGDTTAPVVRFTSPASSGTLSYEADPDDLPASVSVSYSDSGGVETSSFSSIFSFRGVNFNISSLFTKGGASASTSSDTSPMYWTTVATFNTGDFSSGAALKVFGVSSASSGVLNLIETDPDNNLLYVAATSRNKLIFIRLSTGATQREVTLPGMPAIVRACPAYQRVYVSFSGSSSLRSYGSDTGSLQATMSLGAEPKSIVVNERTSRAYVIFDNSTDLKIINCADNSVDSSSLSNIPQRIAVDGMAADKLFYAGGLGGDKGVYRYSAGADQKLISLSQLPEDMAYDNVNGRFFLADYSSDSVAVYNGTTGQVVAASVAVGDQPFSIKSPPSSGRVFVLNKGSDSVTVMVASSASVASTLSLDADPVGISIDWGNGKIYVLQNIWQISGNEQASLTASVSDLSGNTGSTTLNMTIKPVAAGPVGPGTP